MCFLECVQALKRKKEKKFNKGFNKVFPPHIATYYIILNHIVIHFLCGRTRGTDVFLPQEKVIPAMGSACMH